MTMSRSRSVRTGLLTTLALATAFVVGCKGPAPVIPSAPDATGPVSPVSNPGAVEFNVVSGRVTVEGQALAGATVTIKDLATDADASVLTADGRTVPSAQAGLKTDADGRYSVQVGGLTPERVFQVSIETEDSLVTSLVSGDGFDMSGWRVQATTFKADVDEFTTLTTELTAPSLLAIENVLEPAAALPEQRQLLADALELQKQIRQEGDTYTLQQSIVATFKAQLLDSIVKKKDKKEKAQRFFQKLKKLPRVASYTGKVAKLVARLVRLSPQRAIAYFDRLPQKQLVSLNIQLQRRADGTVNIVDGDSGNSLGTVQTNTNTNTGGSGGGTGDTDVLFDPTVPTLSYQTGALTVSVAQPDGDEELEQAAARIAASDITFDTSAVTTATGVAVVDEEEFYFNVVADAAASGETTFPAIWGTTTATVRWNGYLRTDGGVNIAKFRIYENDDYVYLVTDYLENSAVTFTAAHTTTMRTPGAITALSATSADVVMTSREGSTKRISKTIAK